jgi:hypothetical protein
VLTGGDYTLAGGFGPGGALAVPPEGVYLPLVMHNYQGRRDRDRALDIAALPGYNTPIITGCASGPMTAPRPRPGQ